MPFVQVFILLFLIFITLIISLRYILSRNITNATGHLESLSKEYASKQEEITKRLKDAKQEAQEIVAKAKAEAEETRGKLLSETQVQQERILIEARQKGEEMIRKTEKTCEALKSEIEQKIEQGALEKACRMLENALPEDLRKQIHAGWMEKSGTEDFQMGHLNLPDNVKDVKVVSAFPLSGAEKESLKKQLKKRLSNTAHLKEETDPALVAGLVITIGQVVIDGSLRNQIHNAIRRNGQHAANR